MAKPTTTTPHHYFDVDAHTVAIPTPSYLPPEPNNTGKSWWQSKTMWFNIGVAVLGVASTILPVAQPFINAHTFSLLTTAIAIGNMALRTITNEPIINKNQRQ